jgi:hypothetical protein
VNLRDQVRILEEENQRLMAWVHDLQSGMFINCVYCGHRYGPTQSTHAAAVRPDTPAVSMQELLKQHIAQCPKHPMSELIQALKLAEISLVNCIPIGPIPPGDGPLVKIRAALANAGCKS